MFIMSVFENSHLLDAARVENVTSVGAKISNFRLKFLNFVSNLAFNEL